MLTALTLPAGSRAADPGKTLRVTFQVAETGFDPTRTSDYYSGMVIEAIYDRLLTYDYLARPSKLVPLAAESLPQITDNGKTYTFKIKKGIYFTPDPAFKGKKRELTAEDYAYSIKRFFDPRNRSPYAFLFEGKIVGLDELGALAPRRLGDAVGDRTIGEQAGDQDALAREKTHLVSASSARDRGIVADSARFKSWNPASKP